jgi:hypothetical protein
MLPALACSFILFPSIAFCLFCFYAVECRQVCLPLDGFFVGVGSSAVHGAGVENNGSLSWKRLVLEDVPNSDCLSGCVIFLVGFQKMIVPVCLQRARSVKSVCVGGQGFQGPGEK